MKFNPFPPKRDFFKMLSAQAGKTKEGVGQLVRFLDAPTKQSADLVKKIEKEADELRRALIEELNQTFVTPIDREDIFALSRAIDDILDYANTAAEEMVLFEIKPDEHIRKMVGILFEASQNLDEAIRHMQNDASAVSERLLRARKSENSIEDLYRDGLVQLFKTTDFIHILKTREIYRHLSNAADRVVEAANIAGDILVKTT